VQAFIAHREERRTAILKALAAGDETIPLLVARIYVGLDPKLTAAAGRSVYAQLVELIETARVICDGPPSLDSRYRLAR
jgi:hypothetical protein